MNTWTKMPEPQQPNELDYALLSQIAEQESASQRVLAERLGVSVGKLNYCLRAVVDRGWVKVNNFRRSDNKWGYVYLLTPSGVSEKVRLASAFLERKEREFEQLQNEIAALRQEIRTNSLRHER
jgi:MarR family transcriptional regulator, temperature-dependent positive regulator of motility